MLSPNASLIAGILCSIPDIRHRTHGVGALVLVSWNGSIHSVLILNYNALPLASSVILPELLLQSRRELVSLAHEVDLILVLVVLTRS